MLLKGKVALVTGATASVGNVGAILFAQEGAKVIVTGRNLERGQEVVQKIKQQGNEATFIPADVEKVPEIERMVNKAADTYGRIDIFWHNAATMRPGHIEVVKEEDYDTEMNAGLKSAVFATKFVIPYMKKLGKGNILYTSSMVGLRPRAYHPTYSVTHSIERAGVVMLTRTVTEALAQYNIRVNCICPGPLLNENWQKNAALLAKTKGVSIEELKKPVVQALPFKEMISLEAVAHAALFLVSDQAVGITGVALPVDGGYTAV